jgi:hypothetical protein
MTPRSQEEPTTDANGDQTHPAFAVATVHTRSGTPRALFQSDLMHSNTVVLSVQTATRKRDLKRDWIHPRRELIEIEMSETQWGGLVSSMGKGGGVPVTLRRSENETFVAELPYQPRTAENRREVLETVEQLLADAKAAMAALDAAEDGKAGVKERRELRNRLRSTLDNAGGNAKFAIDSLAEATESLVNQARADIETHIMRASAAHGVQASVVFPGLELKEIEAPEQP